MASLSPNTDRIARPRAGRPPDLEKRAAILDAGRRVFLRDGYAASMDRIAEEAGVSKQTIYKHFSAKEQLFMEIVRARADLLTAPLCNNPTDAPPEAVLRQFALSFLDLLQMPDYGCLLRVVAGAAPQFPKLAHDFFEVGPRLAVQRLADYLAAQDTAGRLRIPDPPVAAEQFLSLVSGQCQLRAMLGIPPRLEGGSLEARVDSAVRIFMSAYRT